MIIHWTHNDQLLSLVRQGTWLKLFAHTVHVGVYQKGFMMPATSKIEHFLAKANIFQKKKKSISGIC